MALKLKSVQLAAGVHIPGIASQTLTSGPGRSLDLDLDHGLIAVDTGKSEHLIPLSAVVRLDPISEKYKPAEAPKAAQPPAAPAAPVQDVAKFVKDKDGNIVQAAAKK